MAESKKENAPAVWFAAKPARTETHSSKKVRPDDFRIVRVFEPCPEAQLAALRLVLNSEEMEASHAEAA